MESELTDPQTQAERILKLELAEALAGVGHWSCDLATCAVTCSPEVYRIHGLPAEPRPSYADLIGLYLGSDGARLQSLVQRAAASGEGYEFFGRLRRPDGEVRQVSSRARCLTDREGRPAILFGVFRDETDRIRSEQLTNTLLGRLPVMAAYYTPDLRCRYANGRFLERLGRTPQQMVGLHAREVMGEALFELNRPHIEAALRGEHQVFERALPHPSGRTDQVLAQYLPDLDDDGYVNGFYILVNDVTPLSQARDEARQAAQAKSEFLANMSHELRTPLTAILGFADLLIGQGDTLDLRAFGYVERIKDASSALLTAINDILDFSKLEAGEVQLQSAPFDPSALATSALALFEPQTAAAGLGRRLSLESLPPLCVGDASRIQQILLNLLGNAVKFTPSGEVRLSAGYDQADEVLRYEVADTGIGIPGDKLDRLFQRFSQVDGSTRRQYGGTGLGLAISAALVQAMGGRIGVDSEVGSGSRFWFELPCPPAEPPALQTPTAVEPTGLGGLRVLVVDDNAMNRELVGAICQAAGILAMPCGGGEEAIAMAGEEAFDLILMDIRMPDVDGETAAKAIRGGDGPNAGTPIVAFTADRFSQTSAASKTIFDGEVTKPISAGQLLQAIALAVETARSSGAEPVTARSATLRG